MFTYKLNYEWDEKYLCEGEEAKQSMYFGNLEALIERWSAISHMIKWSHICRFNEHGHLDTNFGKHGFLQFD